MIKNHLYSSILNNLSYNPTNCQERLLQVLSVFILDDKERSLLLVHGYAGTGKTTVISALVNALNQFKIKSFLLAPTGRAAKVIMGYSNQNAYTIHKKIYRQKSAKDGFGEFIIDFNPNKNTIFIVDEASMIGGSTGEYSIFGSGDLLNDLIEYVNRGSNCKLILIGDSAQLPPVGLDISPALNPEYLKKYGFNIKYTELTEVVRQSRDSGILMNSTRIRNNLKVKKNEIQISVKNFSDIHRINGQELIERLTASIEKFGLNEVIVLSRSNKRANIYNQGIRAKILFREGEIETGDILMVVKNNYFWSAGLTIDFIANGDVFEVARIYKYEDIYGLRFAEVRARFIDYDNMETDLLIILDTLNIESAALPAEKNKELFYQIFEDYQEVETKKKKYQKVREDRYFNALQVKFAYAATCHKAQGGQWKEVYVDQGYLTDEMINKEYLRWLYTAFTRATRNLYLVNFNDKFFID